MNKSVIESLVKIANSLDNLGYLKEANRLDKIAQTLAPPVSFETQQDAYNMVGANTPTNTPATTTAPVTPNNKTLSPGQYASTGDYVKDINRFKELLSSGDLNGANALRDSVISSYDLQKRNAFLSQSNKIQYQLTGKYYKENFYTDDQLLNLLNRYNINNNVKDLSAFNKLWNSMMTDLKNRKLLNQQKINILDQTYRTLAARFNFSAYGSNMTGNFETDASQYGRLLHNNLNTEAASLMSQVLSSDKYNDKQKEIFKLRADAQFNNKQVEDNKTLDLGGADYSDLIRNAKDYGVLNSKNIDEFNAAWAKLINYYKTNKFYNRENDPNSPFMYNFPGVQYQLENYRKELLINKGWLKIPSS
jgi:hypothetical protein